MTTAMEATHNALCDDDIREAIEARKKWERDRITELNDAVEKGEARGEARGKAELAKEFARALLAKGHSEDMIFELTGVRLADL